MNLNLKNLKGKCVYVLVGILLVCVIFFVRGLYRYIAKNYRTFDTYYHLYLIDFIRKNGIKDMVEYERFVKPFGNYYPFLLHWLLSFLPKKYDYFVERYFNAFMDAVFMFILYIIYFSLTYSYYLSVMGVLLYLFMPIFFTLEKDGPRIAGFTPRLFGEVLGSGVLICEYFYFSSGEISYAYAAVILAVFVFLSSKFSAQAIVFMNILLSIFLLQLMPLYIVVGAISLSIIVSKGIYWSIMKQQFNHLIWYSRTVKEKKINIARRNDFKDLWHQIKRLDYNAVNETLKVWNSYTIVLLTYPIFFISVALSFISIYEGKISLVDYFIFASFIVFVVTGLKNFLFMGAAERYLIYVAFFIILKLLELNYLPLIVIFSLVLFSKYFFKDLCTLNIVNKGSQDDLLIEWLNIQPNKKVKIATFPVHLGGWRISYETQAHWLYWLIWEREERDYFNNNFVLEYPYIALDKGYEIMQRYDLDFIIIDSTIARQMYGFKRFFADEDILRISNNIFVVPNKYKLSLQKVQTN